MKENTDVEGGTWGPEELAAMMPVSRECYRRLEDERDAWRADAERLAEALRVSTRRSWDVPLRECSCPRCTSLLAHESLCEKYPKEDDSDA